MLINEKKCELEKNFHSLIDRVSMKNIGLNDDDLYRVKWEDLLGKENGKRHLIKSN